MAETPVAVFVLDFGLLEALSANCGPPLDSYVNGWQVWLVDVADDVTLEFRLHPPAGFALPDGVSHHDLWDLAVQAAIDAPHDRDTASLRIGTGALRPLSSLWDLLEVYPAFGEDVDVAQVRAWAEDTVGRSADGAGRVDHAALGAAWKRRGHASDLVGALRSALGVDAGTRGTSHGA